MKVIDCAQRTPEWFAARAGRLTSSRAAAFQATRKDKKEAADRRNLRIQLVLERLTGRPQESTYQSPAMQQGIEREAAALMHYEALTGRLVASAGFCQHDTLMAGASLDGYVDDFAGIVEAKSPLPATHLEYLRTSNVPWDYLQQCYHAMWITGAEWADWFSYCPDFPEPLQMKLVRLHFSPQEREAYGLLVQMFLREVDDEYAEVARLALKAVA